MVLSPFRGFDAPRAVFPSGFEAFNGKQKKPHNSSPTQYRIREIFLRPYERTLFAKSVGRRSNEYHLRSSKKTRNPSPPAVGQTRFDQALPLAASTPKGGDSSCAGPFPAQAHAAGTPIKQQGLMLL